MKLLIAGTHEAMTKALLTQLCSLYEIHMSQDGQEVIHLLQDLRPDVLILALDIHTIDGFSILRTTRYMPLVVVVLTTLITDKAITSSAALGVTQIFPLPCSPKVITDYIKKTIPSLV